MGMSLVCMATWNYIDVKDLAELALLLTDCYSRKLAPYLPSSNTQESGHEPHLCSMAELALVAGV